MLPSCNYFIFQDTPVVNETPASVVSMKPYMLKSSQQIHKSASKNILHNNALPINILCRHYISWDTNFHRFRGSAEPRKLVSMKLYIINETYTET